MSLSTIERKIPLYIHIAHQDQGLSLSAAGPPGIPHLIFHKFLTTTYAHKNTKHARNENVIMPEVT